MYISLRNTIDARDFSRLYSLPPFYSQSCGLRPESLVFSHGLNKCPPDTYFPGLCPDRPFKSRCSAIEKAPLRVMSLR